MHGHFRGKLRLEPYVDFSIQPKPQQSSRRQDAHPIWFGGLPPSWWARRSLLPRPGLLMSVQSLGLPKTVRVQAWVWAALTVFSAAIAFRAGLTELVRRWTVQEEYSHGFL